MHMELERGRVAPFFLLAFGITWTLQIPGVLAQPGLLPGDPDAYMPLVGLGIFGPLVAAMIMAGREGGKAAIKALFAQLLQWRAPVAWWVAALVLPGTLLTGALWLLGLAGREGPVAYLPTLGMLPVALLIAVSEEVGWRGYALPRLQARWGAFAASGLIGVLWCVWHIPMFLGLGIPLDLMPVMLLFFVGSSLFLAWLYNGTQAGLLLAVAGHLGAHLNNSHRALPGEILPLVVHTIVYAALGLWLMRDAIATRPARRIRPSGGSRPRLVS